MKKKVLFVSFILIVCIIFIIKVPYNNNNNVNAESFLPDDSNSQKYIDEQTQNIIDEYETEYNHEFNVATNQIKNQLYGIWQAQEYVGHDGSARYQWDGFWGEIIIFSEKAWIYNGTPWFNPVYVCYEEDIVDMETDSFLNITWKDNKYDNLKGTVILAICTEKNKAFGSAVEPEQLKLIIIGDDLIIERNGTYFRVEKVGEIEWYDTFSNIEMVREDIIVQGDNIESVTQENTDFNVQYVDEKSYEILKAWYAAVDFKGEFKRGDLSVYDEYKTGFKKMLQNEIPFLNKETGEEIYWKDFDDISPYNKYDLSDYENNYDYEYYFFDMDEDGTPELSMRIRMLYWAYFKYNPKIEKCILWYFITDGSDECFGSRKISMDNDGKNYNFRQLSKDGDVECMVYFYSDFINENLTYRMFAAPIYSDKRKEVIITDEMKTQGFYVDWSDMWYFRVTDEQYKELTKAYFEAHELAQVQREEVRYTYEELFGE